MKKEQTHHVFTKEELASLDVEYINIIAQRKLEYQVARLFYTDTTLLSIWTMLNRVPRTTIKTYGFNTKRYPTEFEYNPYFVCMVSDEMLRYVIISQGLKYTLRHATARQLSDKSRHSIASNIAINSLLIGNKDSDVSTAVNYAMSKTELDTPSKYKYEEKLSLEDYYMLLEQEDLNNGGKGGKGQKASNANDNGGNPFESQSDAEGAVGEHMDNENWEQNESSDADVQNAINRIKNSSKNWGNVTGGIIEQILAAHQSPIDWRRLVRYFGNTVKAKEHKATRNRPNRRTEFVDPGKRRKYKSRVLIAPDTSGSVSDEALSEAFVVIMDACKESEIDYICWDMKVGELEKNIGKKYKFNKNYRIEGRGCTDVQCVFDYADEHRYDGVVIITDGYFPEPKGPKYRGSSYIWLMEKGHYNTNISDIVPVGRIFEMEEKGKQIR